MPTKFTFGAAVAALVTLGLAPATATAASTFIYAGNPLECGFPPSCNVNLHRAGFDASFTFLTDFVEGGGDQTRFALRYGVHGVTDWSVNDGQVTLSSADGDFLDPDSSFTFNNHTIRYANFNVARAQAGIYFNSNARLDSDSRYGDQGYAFGQGTWTRGGGVAPNGAVPEPAAWALMIAGFGGVGAVLRRRRSMAALA